MRISRISFDNTTIKNKILREIYAQIKLASPVSFTFLLKKSIDIVSVIFVGHFSAEKYLSGAGLATVTANVTGNSLLVGLSGALSTFCSEANGAKDYEALNLALQRGILIALMLCIPISALWLNSYQLMVSMGQEASIAAYARDYMCGLMPGLWAYAMSICIQNWLHSQQRTKEVALIAAVVALLHPIWTKLFIYNMGIGYLGAAMAVSASRYLELALLLAFLHTSNVVQETEFEWSMKAFSGWPAYFKLALPSLLMISEWWASEIVIFMAGFLANPSLQVIHNSK